MRGMSTLGEVVSRVEEMQKHHWDQTAPVDEIRFDSLNSIRVGSDEFGLNNNAQRQLAIRLGIPFQYLQRCAPDVQAYNLNHWIKKERNENLFLRMKDENVRAIFTPRYTPIDHHQVLDEILKLGYAPETKVQAQLDEGFLMLNITDKERSFQIKENDRMVPGISIGNSEVGLSSLIVSTFILRLICTNGLISTASVDSSYRHISERILNEFPQILNQAKNVDQQRSQFAISLQSKVENPESTLRSFNRQFQLDKQEEEAVNWGWLHERGNTMFHIVNTYTKAAQYPEIHAESAYRLQKVGGNVLALLN
jgi:hypothetical protein